MSNQPIYDVSKSWLENMEEGPFFTDPIPSRKMPDESLWIDFLGYKVASPIGVPSGPLLNSSWIGLAADLGFDILTYKTIRTYDHPSHQTPNVVAVDAPEPLDPAKLPPFLRSLPCIPEDTSKLGITNSFGNPSRSSEYLMKDLPLANSKLSKGQVMVVSVFGRTLDEYVECARFAKNCDSKILEANYSCPNVSAKEGSLYSNPDAVYDFSSKMMKVIGDTPLIIKVGVFSDISIMENTFVAAARAGVRAISGINTISMKVIDSQGKPTLGENRATCGICGHPIHQAAIQFVRDARKIIDRNKLDLTLIATGGVTLPEHFQNFFDAGADVAMTATGMMWNPYLAQQRRVEIYAT